MAVKKFAVLLSGCGVYDGAEIHEACMTFLAIHKHKAEYQAFAPDVEQAHVINHLNGEEMPEKRNVLTESARIARGNIKNIKEYKPEAFDGLILPGGFGVAKNFCSFAFDGIDCKVNPDIREAIIATHQASVPIGALCISPVLITKLIEGSEVTIGNDKGTAEAIESMGGKHEKKGHGEVHIDRVNKVVSNPCYMLDAKLTDIADGAENTVKSMLELM